MIDWQTVIIAGIAALPPTVVAAAAFVQALKTHKSVNSRMTELLEATKAQATAEATVAEQEAQEGRKVARAKERKK